MKEYNLQRPWETLDPEQIRVLDAKGNVVVCSGRQWGKSTVISVKAGEFALNNPGKQILVIAAVERQAYLLFDKILNYIHETSKEQIKRGKDRPTKSQIKLKNGSIIRCLPTGLTGYGIRGYTIDLLIADEAAFIPEAVWTAVTPMLAITRGKIILLSTPIGKGGYFYRCFSEEDNSFEKFHWSSEDCPRKNQEFLDREKESMSKLQYRQEYLAEFIDDLIQFFPTDLIHQCMVRQRRKEISRKRRYYLGVDVARMGEDESTFEIIDRTDRKKLKQVENIMTTKTLTTDTTDKILLLESQYKFKQIFIDAFGVGTGVFDQLLKDKTTRRKTMAIDHYRKALDREQKKMQKVTKFDIYDNLLKLMERGEIELLDDPEIFRSLKSVQFEYGDGGKIKIFGKYTHIADGLVRAAWCSKDKTLSILPFC